MKGDPKIIDMLQEVLKAELTAINQYFLHAEMCENWGYEALAKHTRKESIEEMRHAEKLMERILYLDGTPTMSPATRCNTLSWCSWPVSRRRRRRRRWGRWG